MLRSFVERLVATLVVLALFRARRCYHKPTDLNHSVSREQRSQEGTSSDRIDQAALMGAAVAAVFALVLSPGEYTLLEVVVGITLGAVLLGYYRAPRHHFLWRDALAKASALGAVGALCLSLIVAPVLQNYWLEGRGSGAYCLKAQNEVRDEPQDYRKYVPADYYDCLGDEVNERPSLDMGSGRVRHRRPCLLYDVEERASEGSRTQNVRNQAQF